MFCRKAAKAIVILVPLLGIQYFFTLVKAEGGVAMKAHEYIAAVFVSYQVSPLKLCPVFSSLCNVSYLFVSFRSPSVCPSLLPNFICSVSFCFQVSILFCF